MLCPYVGMKTAKGLMVCFLGSWKNVKVVMPWHPRGNVQTVQILHPRDESPLGTQEGQETHGIKVSSLGNSRLNLDKQRILGPLRLLTMNNKLVRSMKRAKHE